MTGADAWVRQARAGDGRALATLTLGWWRASYAALAAGLDEESAVAQWDSALASPSPDDHLLLVAGTGEETVGYALAGPGDGPGTELADLVVAAGHRRSGHGSRLLAAVVDHLYRAEVTSLLTWVDVRDEARAAFLGSAGFAADGAERELDLDGSGAVVVRQRRWTALLA